MATNTRLFEVKVQAVDPSYECLDIDISDVAHLMREGMLLGSEDEMIVEAVDEAEARAKAEHVWRSQCFPHEMEDIVTVTGIRELTDVEVDVWLAERLVDADEDYSHRDFTGPCNRLGIEKQRRIELVRAVMSSNSWTATVEAVREVSES